MGNKKLGGGGRSIDEHVYLLRDRIVEETHHFPILGDGNCLFRCVAHHSLQDSDRHGEVRARIVTLLKLNREVFYDLMDTDWLVKLTGIRDADYDDYVSYIEEDGSHGDVLALQVWAQANPDFNFRIWRAQDRFLTEEEAKLGGFTSKCGVVRYQDVWVDVCNNAADIYDKTALNLLHTVTPEGVGHFDILRNLTPELFVARNAVHDQHKRHLHAESCKPVMVPLSDLSHNSFSTALPRDALPIPQPKGRHVRRTGSQLLHDKTTDEERDSLNQFRCGCLNEIGCRKVIENGWAWQARVLAWSGSQSERSKYLKEELQKARRVDGNEWGYEYQIGYNVVCESMWMKAFGWTKRTLQRERQIWTRENGKPSRFISSTSRMANEVERVARGECDGTRAMRSFMLFDAERCGERLPITSGKIQMSERLQREVRQKFSQAMRERSEKLKAAGVEITAQVIAEYGDQKDEREINSLVSAKVRLLERQLTMEDMRVELETQEEARWRRGRGIHVDDGAGDCVGDGAGDGDGAEKGTQYHFVPENEDDMGDDFMNDGQFTTDSSGEKSQIRVPHVRVHEWYDEYKIFAEKFGHKIKSLATFRRVWKTEFGYIKCSRPKGTFKLCTTCATISTAMKNATNDAEYHDSKKARDAHLLCQRRQREEYMNIRTHASICPSEVLSLIIDGMDQGKTHLPLLQRRRKDDSTKLMKQKLMGLIAHGLGSYLYVSHPPVVNNANFTIECLWRTLTKLRVRYGEMNLDWPPTLHIQMDNASDNKAKVFFGWAAQLVEEGVFKEVNFNFLLVGHTHEDIDQFFSVISQHFRTLTHHRAQDLVISFEDFVRQVNNAFSAENRPQCVELVTAVHDFTSFYGVPSEDWQNMMQFRRFQIRLPTPVELGTLRGAEAGRAINWGYEYMTSKTHERFPSKDVIDEHGVASVRRSTSSREKGAKPEWDAFDDFKKQRKDKDGNVKLPPASWEGKSSAEILELIKAPWLMWVRNRANYGATEIQIQQFEALMARKVAHVEDLCDEDKAELPEWKLPLGELQAEDPVDRVIALVGKSREAPPPKFTYGSFNISKALKEKRAFHKEQKARQEVRKQQTTFDQIDKGQVLFIKTYSDQRGVEWWFGKSMEAHAEAEFSTEAQVCVQWFYPQYTEKQRKADSSLPRTVAANFLNGNFTPWFLEPEGSGKNGRPNIEEVPRSFVVPLKKIDQRSKELIPFPKLFSGKNLLLVEVKKAIANLGVGFTFDIPTSDLIYKQPEHDVDSE